MQTAYASRAGSEPRSSSRNPRSQGESAPTLVVGAADDQALPIDPHTDAVAAAIPGARREIVAGAHIATVESADRINELILDHLEAA